ncbi:MAG TPA: hypothetical protein VL860_03055, partial [Planctomycetota bacterium]|nr:hypothetical protein [Planctomycetota bacterium]
MSPKPRHTFDDESNPRKTPFEGTPAPAAPSPNAPAPAAPAAAAPPLKRITQLIPLRAPVEKAEPVPAAAPEHPAPIVDADPTLPRSTTIITMVEAEMGVTFISGRVKLQVLQFPAPAAKHRVLIVNEVPGSQPNIDLASQLWLKGCEVVILHNRGESGSDGLFSLKEIEKDVRQCCKPEVETGHHDRLWKSNASLVLIACGVSAPAHCAVAAEDERLGGMVLIEPYVHFPRLADLANSPIQPDGMYRFMELGVINMIGREMLNEEWEGVAQFRNPLTLAEKGGLDHMPILHVAAEKSPLAEMGR